ncbi:MAG: TonB-dependent receptor [Bacteroidetes bacterium]|nr:TonB-dependent receptor [Bacteroidota bacterium]
MFIALLVSLLQAATSVQDSMITIQGVVTDSASGERIPYASVILTDDKRGAVTNRNGEFVFANVRRRAQNVRVSAVSFKTGYFTLRPGAEDVLRVRLSLGESPTVLREVTVLGDSAGMTVLPPGGTVISKQEAKTSVSFFKNDLIRYVTRLPSVVTLNGQSSRYFVRGGGPDQNLVTIDGIRVYNLAHAFGLFSFLDPKIVKTSTFFPGNFGAQYGNRLSSVMDVRTIDGDKNRITGEGSADLFTADMEISGPLALTQGSNSSFVAFCRLPMSSSLLKDFFPTDDRFRFYDGFAKVGGDIEKVGRISAEAFLMGDNVEAQRFCDPSYSWNQWAAAVTGGFFVGGRHLFNFTLSYLKYRTYQSLQTNGGFQNPQKCEVSEPSLSADATYFTDSGNQFNVGMFFSFPSYSYSFTNAYGRPITDTGPIAEPQFWASYRWNISPRLIAILGLRWDIFRATQFLSIWTTGYLADPRLTVLYEFGDRVLLSAGVGRYHQRLINLNDENQIYTPFDLIMPLPADMNEESAWDYTVGAVAAPTVLTTIKAAVYMRNFGRLVGINRQKVEVSDPDFVAGTGFSYGAELSCGYQTEKYYGEVNYSYGYVRKDFGGVEIIPPYDLRHQGNISAGFSPVRGLWLRAFWKITSGLPYTPLAGFFGEIDMNPSDIRSWSTSYVRKEVEFGTLNSARLPGYQSLDMSVEYEMNAFVGDLSFQVAVINLLNRRNVFYFNNVTLDAEYQLARTADFSISFKF